MSSSRKAGSPGPAARPSSTGTRRSGNVTWECENDMSFSSAPEIDKAYSPSRALPEGVFQAHMDLYRDRSLAVYRSRPHERGVVYDARSGQGLDIVPAPG